MLYQHLLEQVYDEWKQQSNDDNAFVSEIVVCKELGEILKKEGFKFEFNPNEYGEESIYCGYDEDSYYIIPIRIDDIDELFYCSYE